MGKYSLAFKKSVAKDLRAFPAKDVHRILKCFELLAQNPRPPGCEKLSGQERYRLRQGVYRIVYEALAQDGALTQEDIARRVGRDRTTVANTLRLLRLPRELREMVASARLDAGHARAILALERAEDQLALGREAARRGLSVREVERRVAQVRAPKGGGGRARKDPNTRAAEERLRAALGTRVEIARRGKGGVLRVAFSSEAELNRLFDLLARGGRGR